MTCRLAIIGFRHGHIRAIHRQATELPEVELVATCEEDAATRRQLAADGIAVTHTDADTAIHETACDAVAIGDCYGRRGELAIRALKAGKHVILDKPICTRMDELEQIAGLACSRNLSVGCQLDLRGSGTYQRLREVVRGGRLGEIHALHFGGQHPLRYGVRPDWYFQPELHGGTINDIAIHAIDFIPWLTGLKFRRIDAARCWHAAAPVDSFRDAAQMMLTLDNGCGVMGDVSYLSPNDTGYGLPMYWRVTLWGSEGVAEIDSASPEIALYAAGAEAPETIAPLAGGPSPFESFLREVGGQREGLLVSTAEVLAAARVALSIQAAADDGAAGVPL